jgi:hypothetical protein
MHMAKGPSSAVAAAAARTMQSAPSKDKLDKLRERAAHASSIELQIVHHKERLQALQEELNNLYYKELPDLMMEAKVDNIGVPGKGNEPGTDYELKPFYSANIAAAWDDEKREAAFNTLKKYKAEGLIKAEVKAAFGKGQLALAKKLIAAAKKLKINLDMKQSVHGQTLTAWVRSIYDEGKALPSSDLEKIGARVGSVVKRKERDE